MYLIYAYGAFAGGSFFVNASALPNGAAYGTCALAVPAGTFSGHATGLTSPAPGVALVVVSGSLVVNGQSVPVSGLMRLDRTARTVACLLHHADGSVAYCTAAAQADIAEDAVPMSSGGIEMF